MSTHATSRSDLDRAVGELHDSARTFARMAPRAKAGLLRACLDRTRAIAGEWSAAGLAAKGLPADSAEEWLAGPLPVVLQLRRLAASLERIATYGRPLFGLRHRARGDGRVVVDLFPDSALDRLIGAGARGYTLMQEAVDVDAARAAQAAFYQQSDPEGGVALILGAGNVSSIPVADVLTKMMNEGWVCLLKVNPVNEWCGPVLERALRPLVDAGFLRVVYGGADVGEYLATHPGVGTVHLTGSQTTHDALVWGPPGPERGARQRAGTTRLGVPVTSELGNITPVVIVPDNYRPAELAFQARSVATMVTNNASFNCVAAKMLVTATGWPQREAFLHLVLDHLARTPTRNAYYPGAGERYATLTQGHELRAVGRPGEGQLPWTVIPGLDAQRRDEPLFRTEPFCPLVSETALGSTDPVEFLRSATGFLNDTLWGTLCAALIVSPRQERDPAVAAALERTVTDLRYGNIVINQWPGLSYTLMSPPWGGHPSASAVDIQSGRGWVHNTFMLGAVDKTVLRTGIVIPGTPIWFSDASGAGRAGPDFVDLAARPRWRKVPRLMARLR